MAVASAACPSLMNEAVPSAAARHEVARAFLDRSRPDARAAEIMLAQGIEVASTRGRGLPELAAEIGVLQAILGNRHLAASPEQWRSLARLAQRMELMIDLTAGRRSCARGPSRVERRAVDELFSDYVLLAGSLSRGDPRGSRERTRGRTGR